MPTGTALPAGTHVHFFFPKHFPERSLMRMLALSGPQPSRAPQSHRLCWGWRVRGQLQVLPCGDKDSGRVTAGHSGWCPWGPGAPPWAVTVQSRPWVSSSVKTALTYLHCVPSAMGNLTCVHPSRLRSSPCLSAGVHLWGVLLSHSTPPQPHDTS